jgi:hypothetical protein
MNGGTKSGVSTISSVGCSALGEIPPAPQKEEEEHFPVEWYFRVYSCFSDLYSNLRDICYEDICM